VEDEEADRDDGAEPQSARLAGNLLAAEGRTPCAAGVEGEDSNDDNRFACCCCCCCCCCALDTKTLNAEANGCCRPCINCSADSGERESKLVRGNEEKPDSAFALRRFCAAAAAAVRAAAFCELCCCGGCCCVVVVALG
jgi:hypothetical protein